MIKCVGYGTTNAQLSDCNQVVFFDGTVRLLFINVIGL